MDDEIAWSNAESALSYEVRDSGATDRLSGLRIWEFFYVHLSLSAEVDHLPSR